MTANVYGGLNVLKSDSVEGCTTLHTLNTTELSALTEYILQYMNYVSIKLCKSNSDWVGKNAIARGW